MPQKEGGYIHIPVNHKQFTLYIWFLFSDATRRLRHHAVPDTGTQLVVRCTVDTANVQSTAAGSKEKICMRKKGRAAPRPVRAATLDENFSEAHEVEL